MSKTFAFISYTRADQDSALLLHRELKDTFGARKAWLDHENIKGGTEWMASIDEAIETCSAFIVLIGKGWVAPEKLASMQNPDDVVRKEVERALARRADPKDNLIIMPILVDGAKMPSASDLPPSMASLLAIDAPDIRGHTLHNDLKPEVVPALVKSIGPTLIGETKPQRRRRLAWLYTKLTVVLGVFLASSFGIVTWLTHQSYQSELESAGISLRPKLTDIPKSEMTLEHYAVAVGAAVSAFAIVLILVWQFGGLGRYRLTTDDDMRSRAR